jgi:ornithine cyclodeaminase/alanine dehydrogenase-like protein (mu-crystallin family)
MRVLSAADLDRIFTFPDLIEALRRAFQAGAVTPLRQHHTIELPGEAAATLLVMPAWDDFLAAGTADGGHIGVKIVAVHPGNAARGLPSVQGAYLLMAGTGEPAALIDGKALTLWRTAAASALAASYLAREDADRLVMVGAGALAPYLIRAHASIRPLAEVLVWNRNAAGAERLASTLQHEAFAIRAAADIEAAVRSADIVSSATLSNVPLVRGAWLKPGVHLDLVGAFTPEMRECDDQAVARARIYVDTRAGALKEGGDLVQAIRAGALAAGDVAGDLSELCRGEAAGRRSREEITLFKSVGTAIEDLAAARLAFEASRT